MLALLLTVIVSGQATYYSAGVMERVVANRLAWGHITPCAECIGYVALLEPEHIGTQVWLQRPGQPSEGPFLVADCATAAHRAALQARGWAVDVDWQTAQRWQMRGPVPVEVLRAAERDVTCRMQDFGCDRRSLR